MRSRRLGRAALIALLVIAPAAAALAGWQDDYKEGRKALNEGKLSRAEKLLRSAIASRNAEKAGAIKVSGMFFEPYLPHYYLGMTLFKKKDYTGAVSELETSEKMGVSGDDPSLRTQLSETLSTARTLAEAEASQRASQPSKPPPTAEPGSNAGPSAPKGTDRSVPEGSTPAGGGKSPTPKTVKAERLKPPSGSDAGLKKAIDAAAGDIAAAQSFEHEAGALLHPDEKKRLDSASRAVRDAKSAQEATSLRQALQKLRADLSARVDQRRREEAALATAQKESAPVASEAEAFLSKSHSDLKPSERQRLTHGIASVRNGSSAGAVRAAARSLRSDVTALRKDLAQRKQAPPSQSGAAAAAAVASARRSYANAVKAYFQGDYDAAVPDLESAGDTIETDPEIPAMLGAALYKKYILTRSQDEALKDQAGEAFRSAIAIRPGFTLDPKFYPPKVIAFFKQVAAGAAPGS